MDYKKHLIMKRTNSILIVAIIFASLFLTSCVGSVKGKWSESDKQSFLKDMEGVKELSNLGDNKEKWIECYLNKCEANFTSYKEADSDVDGCKKIALECSDEVLSNGSIQGQWSDIDKQKFRRDMEELEELSYLADNKTKWIECYLNKCEANYSSYYKADMDEEGCGKIAMECSREFFSNGSVLGEWSETDRQDFIRDMEGIEELAILGEKKTKWIECYLNKCEANYSSYYDANTDAAGCEKIALECSTEMGS